MKKQWIKVLALVLTVAMMLGIFSACGKKPQQKPGSDQTATNTEDPKEATVLKVLTLGHSLAVDSGHMLNLVAQAEGYEGLKIGTLYYSGCPLHKHVQFMNGDSSEYQLYVSSTDTPDQPPQILDGVTMEQAILYDYWDVIVMQGGVFEIAKDDTFTNGNIQKIQAYVNERKLNPNAIFAWHMTWATPTDHVLRNTYPQADNVYYTNYADFDDDRTTFYQEITRCAGTHILTDDTFQFVIPTGTAIENALSSYLEERDLHRDYAHASDLGRVIASYTWFCRLTGVDKLEQIKLDVIPMAFFKSTTSFEDRVLTDAEKAIILESVNNALATPLEMTQSQYTQAPTA